MRTEPHTARAMTQARPRTPIALAAETYVLLFPAGHLMFLPVAGAVATAADAALLVLLVAWAVDLPARPGALAAMGRAWAGESVPGLPTRRYLAVAGALGRRPWEVAGASRVRRALGLALVAVAVGALFMAREDLRHVWVLMGMVGVAVGEGE